MRAGTLTDSNPTWALACVAVVCVLQGAAASSSLVLEADEATLLPPVERISLATAASLGHAPDLVNRGIVNADFTETRGAYMDLVPVNGTSKELRLEAESDRPLCAPRLEQLPDCGGARLWYQCYGPGMCLMTATVHAAPEPVTLHWVHQCGGEAHPGANVGSQATLADVARGGVATEDWNPAHPLMELPAEQSTTLLYVQPKAGQPDVHLRALDVRAEPSDMLKFYVYGDYDRQSRPFHRRSGVSNIALFRPANMSSQLCGHFARRAVDGVTIGNDSFLHLAMTGNHGVDAEPWLEVDLGAEGLRSDIMEVRLWNRVDGPPVIAERLFPCWVMLFDTVEPPPRNLEDARNAAVVRPRLSRSSRLSVWKLDQPVRARWIRVQLERTTYLQLAELEVYAATGEGRCPQPVSPQVLDDPVCYTATPERPKHADIVYECMAPGTAEVKATLPIYPPWGPYDPVQLGWRKQCTNRRHEKLRIGTTVGGNEVVRMGVTQPNYLPAVDPTVEWLGGVGMFESPDTAAVDGEAEQEDRQAESEGLENSSEAQASAGAQPAESTAQAEEMASAMAVVPGEEVETVFYLQTSAIGAELDMAAPVIDVSVGGDKVLKPGLFGRLSKGGKVTHQPKTLRLRYGCIAEGEAIVTVSFKAVPHLQPYGPVAFAVRKQCGGRRLEVDVYRAEPGPKGEDEDEDGDEDEDEEEATEVDPENAVPEDVPSVMQSGVPDGHYVRVGLDGLTDEQAAALWKRAAAEDSATGATGAAQEGGEDADAAGDEGGDEDGSNAPPAAAASGMHLARVLRASVSDSSGASSSSSSSDSSAGQLRLAEEPRMVIGEGEDSTTFFVRVPPTEEECAQGLDSRQPVQCADESDQMCTQLRTDGSGVAAWCSPDVCASGSLGFGSGPEISGEIVGAPATEATPTDRPSLTLTYHCTDTERVLVTVRMSVSDFNDPLEFSFTKECYSWRGTWWGVGVMVLSVAAVVGAVGYGLWRAEVYTKVRKSLLADR